MVDKISASAAPERLPDTSVGQSAVHYVTMFASTSDMSDRQL
jgi:hypothetical protein